MPSKKTVIAVIPHYNMPQTLTALLRQAVSQKYDSIYVLDDHSTNCDIKKVVQPFSHAVTLIAGNKNLGAAANRNRILKVKGLNDTLIHFIDADCELISDNTPEKVRKLFLDPKVGAIGGLILNPNGGQMEFNYFPRTSWRGGLLGILLLAAIACGYTNPSRGKKLPLFLRRILSDFPDPHVPPSAKNVFAVAEANMVIPFSTFRQIGGFDEKLRYAEAQDLAYKLRTQNLTVRFDPLITVRHLLVQLADKKRGRDMWHGNIHLARKYGLPWR